MIALSFCYIFNEKARDVEVTFEMELSYSYSYFQMGN